MESFVHHGEPRGEREAGTARPRHYKVLYGTAGRRPACFVLAVVAPDRVVSDRGVCRIARSPSSHRSTPWGLPGGTPSFDPRPVQVPGILPRRAVPGKSPGPARWSGALVVVGSSLTPSGSGMGCPRESLSRALGIGTSRSRQRGPSVILVAARPGSVNTVSWCVYDSVAVLGGIHVARPPHRRGGVRSAQPHMAQRVWWCCEGGRASGARIVRKAASGLLYDRVLPLNGLEPSRSAEGLR